MGIESVVKYLRKEGIDKEDTYNLGDTTGMFPDVIPAIEMVQSECNLSLLGNHDAVVLHYFEDQPKRWERIAVAEQNRLTLENQKPGLLDWLDSLPLESKIEEKVYVVHNNPFGEKNRFDRDYMLARFGPVMKDPGEEKYNPIASKLVEASNGPHITLRGHAHAPCVHKVRRGLKTPAKGSIEEIRIKKEQNSFTLDLNPDFAYIITAGSACGANTRFTPDSELDYRPAGTILNYDSKSERGKLTFFRIFEGYDSRDFINSVAFNPKWIDFEEAQKQVRYLSKSLSR